MHIKRILLSLSMLLPAPTGLMAQTTDEKSRDRDSDHAQKLLKPDTTANDFILPIPNG